MHETPEELRDLDELLAGSYARGGPHLREIHVEDARLDAAALVERMPWMQVAVVATVTADGRPLTGPVDAFLLHGRFWFGTDRGAVRARHLAARPQVSLTHARGEELVVTAHGRARRVEARETPELAEHLRAFYDSALDEHDLLANPYFVVDADRLLAADLSVLRAGG